MLQSARRLQDYTIYAIRAKIGKVQDLYFDINTWSVQYLGINVNAQVFISTQMLGAPIREERCLPYRGTKQSFTRTATPDLPAGEHLETFTKIIGYHIQTSEDHIGLIEDCLINIKTWVISFLVINARSWSTKGKIVVVPTWIKKADYDKGKFQISFPLLIKKTALITE